MRKKIIILIILILICVFVILGLIMIFKAPGGEGEEKLIKKDPWGGCGEKIEGYDPEFDDKYNYQSTMDITTEKQAEPNLIISKDGSKKTFSLGRYRLHLEENSILFVPKLWLFFSSDKLSDREDKLYGLQDSYLSKIIFKAGEYTKEVKLGGTGEHSFIELANCPIGNFAAVDDKTAIEFEFLLEMGCNNLDNGVCLDNQSKPLDYLNGADISATIRFFARSAEAFNKDINILSEFKYE